MPTAADVMTSPVESISAGATVGEALHQMRAHAVSSLLVEPLDPLDPPGFFSQTDAIARIVAPGLEAAGVRVGDVMSRPVITVPPETSIPDCARLMANAHIRRVLVHDGVGIVGIVSASDILGGDGP